MAQHPIFEAVRQHLQQGETGAALHTLITYLETEGTKTELLQTLRVIQSNYNAAKQQELKGILAFQEAQREYSKVTDALLTAMDDLAAGRPAGTRITPVATAQPNRMRWIIGGIAGIVVIAAAAFFFTRKPADSATTDSKPSMCPNFRDSAYHVLLLPFLSLSKDELRPSVSVQARIRTLTQNNDIVADVEIANEDRRKELPDVYTAREVGHKCDADLIVWGQFEKVGDSIQVDVHYLFLGSKKNEEISGHTDFQPFRSLSAMQKMGQSSGLRTLDDAILSLCSVMAIHVGRVDVAEKWLNKIQTTTEKDDSLKQAVARVKADRLETEKKERRKK